MSNGIGVKGIGVVPIERMGAVSEAVFDFNLSQATFTAAMAVRSGAVFAGSPMVQGKYDGTGTPDVLSFSRGSQIISNWYANFDPYQGSISFWITPEWNGNDGREHNIITIVSSSVFIYKTAANYLRMVIGSIDTNVSVAGWVAGTKYHVVIRWNLKTTLDGTNYSCISVNDSHTFNDSAITSTIPTPDALLYIGSLNTVMPMSARIEGFTIYRRVLWDGAYGENLGLGDEINLIWAAGVGKDPCLITGSWDVVFCFPTNSTPGSLVTGTGHAWSHPHSSNLLNSGWLEDGYYGGGQWGVAFNGTSSYIDCGSGATLDDIPSGGIIQIEAWVKFVGTAGAIQIIASKGQIAVSGWNIHLSSVGLEMYVQCAGGTVIGSNTLLKTTTIDRKFHHIVFHYDDTTKIARIAFDGIWGSNSSAGSGAYVSDAALPLRFGRQATSTAYYLNGVLGWIRIDNAAIYTPGTNFKPPRTFSSVGMVEAWSMADGSGGTVAASITSPGNDGTITNGTWQPQWYPLGTPILPTSLRGGTSFTVNVGSGATIDDLHANAFTAEGWILVPKTGQIMYMFGGIGWYLRFNADGTTPRIRVLTDTNNASFESALNIRDGLNHHLAITYDNGGDRHIRVWLDGIYIGTGATPATGVIISDAGNDKSISLASYPLLSVCNLGWCRYSNIKRYADGVNFTPDPRTNPPGIDANTMAQWNMDEGYGTAPQDSSGNANHGTISGTYTWNNTPGMQTDSPNARIYLGGYVLGDDAVDEGVQQTLVGLTAGANYVIRALGYSEDGVGQPEVEVYDETNAATIGVVTGTTTSTEHAPDHIIYSFELPTIARGAVADCVSISVRLKNNAASGVVGFHQVELLENLLDNPSFQTGAIADPWIPDGWTNYNLDVGDTEIDAAGHSGGNCVEWNTGASGESFYEQVTSVVGKFYSWGYWHYGDGSKTIRLNEQLASRAALHYSLSAPTLTPASTASWIFVPSVWRARHLTPRWEMNAETGAVGDRFTDDAYMVTLDDVSLTVTPANYVNSLEGLGIRADGRDQLYQSTNALGLGGGHIRFFVTPRHSATNACLLGNATPTVYYGLGDATNYIHLDFSAASTLRLRYDAGGAGVQTGTWNPATMDAATEYMIDIVYGGFGMMVFVNGTQRISISAACAFTVVPSTGYFGMDSSGAQQYDSVFR